MEAVVGAEAAADAQMLRPQQQVLAWPGRLRFPRSNGRASESQQAQPGSLHAQWPAHLGTTVKRLGAFSGLEGADKGRFGTSLAVLTGKGRERGFSEESSPPALHPTPSAPPAPEPNPLGGTTPEVLSPSTWRSPTPSTPGRLRSEGKKERPCLQSRVEPRWVTMGSFQAFVCS